MGILALANPVVLDPRDIIDRMQRRFPSYKGPSLEAGEIDAHDRVRYGGCQFRIGEMHANIGAIPAPIFPTVLDPAVRSATDWPDAGRQLSRHRAQLIVEVLSPSGGTVVGRLDAACMAMMLCSVLADLTPVLGIYWKSAGTITEPERFQDRSGGLLSGDFPFDIWIQINRPRDSLFRSTTGLRDILGREMEFKAAGLSEAEVLLRAHTAGRQLIAHGDELQDSQQIPYDDDEDIWPLALLEGEREDIPVWSLTFKASDGAAGRPIAGPRAPFSGGVASAPAADSGSAHSRPSPAGGSSGGTIQMPRGRPGGDKCEPGSFTAFLVLETPAAVGQAELLERMGQQFPQLQSRIKSLAPGGEPRAPDAPMIFFMGDSMMTVMFIDQPMPPGTLSIAARASRTWPGGEAVLVAHRAHVIIHARSGGKDWAGALNCAQNVSAVSAALAGMLPTIGVYWSAGWAVSKPDEFIGNTGQVLAGKYSAADWFQFWYLDGPPTDRGEPTIAVLTTGLEPFFGREIEFLPAALPPGTIAHRLLGVIEYLLTNGPVLNDGDTLGVSYDEAIRVRYAAQGQRPGIPVIQLTLEQIDQKVPPKQGAGDRPLHEAQTAPSDGGLATGSGDDLKKFTTHIPLKQVASVEEEQFNECLKARFPDFHAKVTSGWRKPDISAIGERVAFDMDGHEVGIMFVNRPSRPDMVAPALRAGSGWPGAEQDLVGHQGCVIVHVEPLGKDWAAALSCARIVTAVSAVLAELLPAIGVVWNEGETFTKAPVFAESASRVLSGQYSKANWFRHWVAADPDLPEAERMIAMGTIGLKAILGREIEFTPVRVPPPIMAKRLLGAVQYLLTKGPVFKDGSVLRVGETDRIRVRHGDTGTALGVPVYLLTLETAGSERAEPSGRPSPEAPPASQAQPEPLSPPDRDPPADGERGTPSENETDKPRKALFGRRGLH